MALTIFSIPSGFAAATNLRLSKPCIVSSPKKSLVYHAPLLVIKPRARASRRYVSAISIPPSAATSITDINLSDRLAFVEYIINKVGTGGALIIDGIVDICEDYNDQKGSRQLIDHLKVLISKNNTLLIPVLHNARSTGSARGHLGTELINKSKAVINVKKDDDAGTSSVSFEYIRGNREPQKFEISHDINGNLRLENP